VENTDDIISGSSLFSRLQGEDRKRLAAAAQRKRMGAGTILCHEGEPGDAIFIVMQGSLSILAKNDDGEDEELTRLQSGAVVGEISVVTGSPRTATVKVASDSWVMRIPGEVVMEVLSKHPAVLADLRRLGLARSEDTLHRILTDDMPGAGDEEE